MTNAHLSGIVLTAVQLFELLQGQLPGLGQLHHAVTLLPHLLQRCLHLVNTQGLVWTRSGA